MMGAPRRKGRKHIQTKEAVFEATVLRLFSGYGRDTRYAFLLREADWPAGLSTRQRRPILRAGWVHTEEHGKKGEGGFRWRPLSF